MNYRDIFDINATLVANEFLEEYMPKANGDYVKVYLYLLKNRVGGIDYGTIAEALCLTEGDVRRAVKYWEELGIITIGIDKIDKRKEESKAAGYNDTRSKATESDINKSGSGAYPATNETVAKSIEDRERALLSEEELRNRYRRTDCREIIDNLSEDPEYRKLLFIVQKYMSKILTDNDQQVFAYLYDGLHLPCDVIDYLVDYCVQKGHNNIKYIEKVGLDWARLGINTVAAAKNRTREFDRQNDDYNRKKQTRNSKRGIVRDTDYDSLVLEQVIRKME
ncbi:MAG: DnaD domain protein [Eubacteriales bacterium]|nr:DnaD domain protein [Eubacteriales bacterium]